MIYGFVQQRRMVESRVQMEKCQQQVDSLKTTMKRMNEQMIIAQKQLQVERNNAVSASDNH